MLDAETRRLARELGDELFGRGRAPANPEPAPAPADTRPRFRDGRLKDLRADLEERLDFDLINDETNDPRAAQYRREHAEEIDLWMQRFGSAQRQEQYDAQERADNERAAARLGVTVEEMLDGNRAEEMRQRHENILLDEQAAEILARKKPIPAPEPEEEPTP